MDTPMSSAEDGDEGVFCSVLNVVIDYDMAEPTTLEPEEYDVQHSNKDDDTDVKNIKKIQQQVPVIRIFGPVLRENSINPPLQSACLHIHGAFPYMIARPRVAGPDGSLRGYTNSGHIDWDDREAVECIVDTIHQTLESTLQSYNLQNQQERNTATENGAGDKVAHDKIPQNKFIRSMTVVEGRGFYTYCNGPPCPFLRVEYYDPKLRWKVKMLLERGLEVPRSYLPDARQYDRNDTNEDLLKFHCYEAHIPYTMQFFKDWNLAGMSYIRLREVKFRGRIGNYSKEYYAQKAKDSSMLFNENDIFLPTNTSESFLWNREYSNSSTDTLAQRTKKISSCDVEMDCTVDDILNRDAVMKTMPEDDKDDIHWRAVPSLQEIWKEERIRMRQLLGAQHDLVAKPLSFTLNVKKDAARPGARPALKGMRKLVAVTHGLQDDFKRSLLEILNRHAKAIQEMDERIATIRQEKETRRQESGLTPTLDDAVDALEFLAAESHQGETPNSVNTIDHGTSGEDWLLSSSQSEALSRSGGQSQTSSQQSMENLNISGHQQLSYSCSQDMHDQDLTPSRHSDPLAYSQRIERGDAIIEDIDDTIDPQTLLPYQELAFGKDTCRAIFEVGTDPCGTKRVCGGRLACSRHGHHVVMHRARPKYYKTINTGAYVDGVINQRNLHEDIASQSAHDGRFAEERLSDDELSEDEEEVMRDLLATQIPDDKPSARPTQDLTRYGISLTPHHPGLGQGSATQATATDKGSFASSFEASDDESADEEEPEEQSMVVNDATEIHLSNETPGSVLSQELHEMIQQSLVTPRELAPTRAQLMGGGSQEQLHPLPGNGDLPEWLGHSERYSSLRSTQQTNGITSFETIAASLCQGHNVHPVAMPPTRGRVVAWQKKREAPNRNPKGSPAAKRERVEQGLEIDGNSRKLVPIVKAKPAKSGSEGASSSYQQVVEEVQWVSSQAWQLTPSQPSQNESDATEIELAAKRGFAKSNAALLLGSDSALNSSSCGASLKSDSISNSGTQNSDQALEGIGQQGGRIHIQGGGGLKTRTNVSQGVESHPEDHGLIGDRKRTYGLPSPISFMSIEIHVQCRTGYSRLDAETKIHKKIALTANPRKKDDKVSAIVYIHGRDPGGGKSLEVLSRGCLFVPLRARKEDGDLKLQKRRISASLPGATMGITSPLSVESFKDEKSLLRRFGNIVRLKDPDMILSWDTQGAGLGYIIERGTNGAEVVCDEGSRLETIDMARLLGRTPSDQTRTSFFGKKDANTASEATNEKESTGEKTENTWRGSGLGSDWDEKVGAGAAAASVVGRLVFAGWKIVAEEVKHANASYLPAVVAAVLNRRIPHHDELTLTQWYSSGNERWRVLNHRLTQATSYLLLFDALDIIGRAGEAARLSGVEFSQSFPGIRGSQYKVEGVLLRALQSLRSDERGSKKGKLLKSEDTQTRRKYNGSSSLTNDMKSPTQEAWKMRRAGQSSLENRHYFFFSSSAEDANMQEALEVQALTLEPQSGHYTDPVVVCDFTALYPSLMIAYNLCYSTCAGKIEYHSTRKEMQVEGTTSGHVGPFLYPERRTATVISDHFKSLGNSDDHASNSDRAYVSPTGTMYVSEDVVKGVLPLVLEEILTTRAMLKKAAKEYKKNVKGLSPAILRQLEARQLALKYVANVTYGYTSATFSGRCAMPLLADTIVECGRKTLRRAIDLANTWGRESARWKGSRVVYGDTDSLFIVLPGRSYKEAFIFGEELCEAVRKDNPPPVELKLEKVYAGSIMQTMKKYCGMKFEWQTQKKPVFEAKGLETVRRDQCALTQKVLRNALIKLFNSGIGAVKEYLFRQWSLIYAGNLPVSDFILTGRVRSRYRGGREGPVQAVLANRIRGADPDFIIRNKQRLPYVIMDRGKNCTLKDCVLTPLELLEHWNTFKIHAGYYIEKHVNASLQRCLGLAPHRIDINAWFRECPRPRRRVHFWPTKSYMITDWFGSGVCTFCEKSCHASGRSRVGVCTDCRNDPIRTTQMALPMLQQAEQAANLLAKECQKCNRCFESAETFATERFDEDSNKKALVFPLANCVCIDCPNTFKRHRLRELLIEASNTCEVLGLDF